MTALMQFKSHIAGKNADVTIHEDHIEWTREGRFGMAQAAMAVGTAGLSLAAKGGRQGSKGAGSEMIPVKSITSVTTRKDGMRFWAVSVICGGNTIDMRVTKDEAEQVKGTLQRLILT